jgi:hypothetical protein
MKPELKLVTYFGGVMKSFVMALALFFMAGQASGQQSGTTTECEKQLDKLVCKTQQDPPSLAEMLDFSKRKASRPQAAAAPSGSPQISPEAIKQLVAEEQKAQDAKDTVDYIYCRQNPKSGIKQSEGQPKSCTEVIEYTKAFCSVNTEAERCNLARSKAEVEKAFAALVDEYSTNTHRNRNWEQTYFGEKFAKLTKWGCMSFPDMTLPQRDGASHPCPNAPESAHADAGPQTK